MKNNMTYLRKRSLFLFLIIAVIPAVVFAKETIGDYVIEFDQKLESDTNDDGKNDLTSYYLGDRLVWSASDNDRDGKLDLWLRYRNGDAVDLELYDTDSDGNPDKIAEFDYQGKREVVYDSSAKFPSESSFTSSIIWLLALAGIGYVGYRYKVKKTA